ncbi:MAG TPA: DUF523 domain-containing protein [Firmicutes bacterium]|nr:DUF523 domain-containing protein [Bacillota bacterium]
MYIVSSCLAGVECRYDGKSNAVTEIVELVKEGAAIPLCPEVLGGLCIPRIPCEIVEGKVLTQSGHDVTAAFEMGAQKTLEIAKVLGANKAILKSKSPSCGCGQIYDGTFSRQLKNGNGIAAQVLLAHGFCVQTEDEFVANTVSGQ